MLTMSCAVLLAATGMPADAAPIETASLQRPLLGGYANVDVSDAGVQAAAAFAAQSVEAEVGEVTSAQRQSAGGINYKLSFTTADGRVYDAIVRRALDQTLSVTSIEEKGDHHGEPEGAEPAEDE